MSNPKIFKSMYVKLTAAPRGTFLGGSRGSFGCKDGSAAGHRSMKCASTNVLNVSFTPFANSPSADQRIKNQLPQKHGNSDNISTSELDIEICK